MSKAVLALAPWCVVLTGCATDSATPQLQESVGEARAALVDTSSCLPGHLPV
jgi:hypothetical protein